MSNQGQGYGPVSDSIGVAFWAIAGLTFTSPFWLPFVALFIGSVFGIFVS